MCSHLFSKLCQSTVVSNKTPILCSFPAQNIQSFSKVPCSQHSLSAAVSFACVLCLLKEMICLYVQSDGAEEGDEMSLIHFSGDT